VLAAAAVNIQASGRGGLRLGGGKSMKACAKKDKSFCGMQIIGGGVEEMCRHVQ